MKKKVQRVLIFLVLLALVHGMFLYPKSKSKIRFFSPRSFYIYVMGSYHYFAPPIDFYLALGSESTDAFAPVLGIGYRIVNFWDRLFISLEADFSTARYDFGDFSRNQNISLLTFMLNIEGTLSSRVPVILFGGAGVGVHWMTDLGYSAIPGDYIWYGDDHLTVLALDLGIKIPLSRHLLIRAEYQWNGEVYGSFDYYDEYWYDEWDDTRWDFLSSSLSVGLEYHF
jgi:opacity protein-like surface antigen